MQTLTVTIEPKQYDALTRLALRDYEGNVSAAARAVLAEYIKQVPPREKPRPLGKLEVE